MQDVAEDIKYKEFLSKIYHESEAVCVRCGACCGLFEGDPCEHLIGLRNGKYFCDIYENRFGMHKTKSGGLVRCVSVREIINKDWPGSWQCAYKTKKSESVC